MKQDRLLEMEVFKAVAELGSFTAAAAALGLSQSMVSRAVARLERRLGASLVHRSTRRMRLTDEGNVFLQWCRRILDDVGEAQRSVVSARSCPSGVLRVSSAVAFGLDQIVPLIPEFLARNPQLEVRLSLSDGIADLIEERVDVAIRLGQLANSSLVARKLGDLQRIVVAAPSYVSRFGRPCTPDELMQHGCLLWDEPHKHLNRWPFVVDDRVYEVKVGGRFTANNGQSLYALAVQGSGIMRLAEHLALPAIRKGLLVPLLGEFLHRDVTAINAVYVETTLIVPKVRAFIDFLVESFYPQPPWKRQAAEADGHPARGLAGSRPFA